MKTYGMLTMLCVSHVNKFPSMSKVWHNSIYSQQEKEGEDEACETVKNVAPVRRSIASVLVLMERAEYGT